VSTERLIEHLTRDLRPTAPLRAPWTRAARWLLVAVVYLGVLAVITTSQADLAANRAIGWPFLAAQGAAIATAAAAALAALASTVPGLSKWVFIVPMVTLTVWLGSLAAGTAFEWSALDTATLAPAHEWLCVALIVLGGAPLWIVLAFMLRQGAPLAPRVTAALGALAVAAGMNVAACISYPHPSSVTLIWHGSTIGALMVAAAAAGNTLAVSWAQRHRIARAE
jgi:Negative regulator of sigma F